MRSNFELNVEDPDSLKKLKDQVDQRAYTNVVEVIRDFRHDINRIDQRLSQLTDDTTQFAQSYLTLQGLQQKLNDVLVKINRKCDACRNLLNDFDKANANFVTFMADVQSQINNITVDCKEMTSVKNEINLIPTNEFLTQQLKEIFQELDKVKVYLANLTAPSLYARQALIVSTYNDMRTQFTDRLRQSLSVADKLKSTVESALKNNKQDKLKSAQITLDKEVTDCKAKVTVLFDHVRGLNEKITKQKGQTSLFNQPASPKNSPQKPPAPTSKNAKK